MDKEKRNFIYAAIVIFIITFTMRATNNMVVTTVPLFVKLDLGFSYFTVGAISAFIYLLSFISTVYVNPRLKHRTRRVLFIAANAAIMLVLLLYSYSGAVTVWLASLLAGLAFGLIIPNLMTSASLRKDQVEREKMIGLFTIGLSLSLILGPGLEDILLNYFDYRFVFLLFLPIASVGLIMSTLVKFPTAKNEDHVDVTKNAGLRAAILTVTTYNIPFAAITIFLAIYAISRFHVSGVLAYSLYIPFFTVSLLTRVYMTARPSKNIKMLLAASIAITLLALLSTPFLPNFYAFLLIMALLGIPHGSIFPLATIMISRGTTVRKRNAANSYFIAFNNILFMVVPFTFGYLLKYIGFTYAFMVLALPVAASAFLLFWLYGNDERFFPRRSAVVSKA